VGSEQGGVRPVLIIQNDVGNKFSATTIVAPLTTREKTEIPTHVPVRLGDVDNVILLEQMRAISRTRLISRYGELTKDEIAQVDQAIRISLGISDESNKIQTARVLPPHRERRICAKSTNT